VLLVVARQNEKAQFRVVDVACKVIVALCEIEHSLADKTT
jgi:hypothetical protein